MMPTSTVKQESKKASKQKKKKKGRQTRKTCSFMSVTATSLILSTLAGNNLLMGK